MSPLSSTIISIVFLIAGLVAVFSMFSLQGRKVENRTVYVTIHKTSGYVFAALFLLMFITMIWRVEDYWEESSARIAIHVALAIAVFFVLAIKIMVPRYYKKLMGHLFGLGVLTYVLSFTLVLNTAGYYLFWEAKGQEYITTAKMQMPEMLDEQMGKNLFITKCSTCHLLDEIMKPRSADDWEEVVNQMVEIASPRIKPAEGEQILYYLSKTHVPEHAPEKGSLMEMHCLPCHSKSDIYESNYSRQGWRTIVNRMHEYDSKIVPESKIERLVNFLIEQQSEMAPPGEETRE